MILRSGGRRGALGLVDVDVVVVPDVVMDAIVVVVAIVVGLMSVTIVQAHAYAAIVDTVMWVVVIVLIVIKGKLFLRE